MKNCKEMCCKFCAKWMNRNLGLLILRVALGVIFVAHGWQKFGIMDQWTGFVTGGAEVGGLGLPMVLVYLIPAIEILAGLAMVFGISTCAAGILLAVVMVGAIVKVKWGGTLIPDQSGAPAYELDLILLAASLAVAFAGPGKYSLAARIKNNCGDADCSNCKVK